ncbi:hypothetical protein [Perlucidibaca aquatica]|uniref:hypothetical protein n=1 Tax=Perlucidibaca aquatica TaxID=1852776 RepID=UPI0012FE4EB7|nr:hypothetical protein [Perlucidibaca aquatica]
MFIVKQNELNSVVRSDFAAPALMAIAPDLPELTTLPAVVPEIVSEEVHEAEPKLPVGKVCARLGVFPSRDWAERVAEILADDTGSAQSLVKAWRIDKVALNKYFIRFESWSLDKLAERMTQERANLKKLISITAIPEQC